MAQGHAIKASRELLCTSTDYRAWKENPLLAVLWLALNFLWLGGSFRNGGFVFG